MEDRRSNWPVPVLVAVIVFVGGISYIVSYLTLGEHALAAPIATSPGQSVPGQAPTRVFATKWQAMLFTPAAKIESVITGEEIATGSRGWD